MACAARAIGWPFAFGLVLVAVLEKSLIDDDGEDENEDDGEDEDEDEDENEVEWQQRHCCPGCSLC